MWTHAETYKGLGLDKLVHKARLKKLFQKLQGLDYAVKGLWADFGCSDGFILERIRTKLSLNEWEFYGLDHSYDLLSKAENRNIPNSSFIPFDLNKEDRNFLGNFDVVTCFETIEHTGNYKNAFKNLYMATKSNGYIIVSVPNEVGIIGLIKFAGRKFLRRNPYVSFFDNSKLNEFKYIVALITGKDIESFRNSNAKGWGPHLGFNYKNFENLLMFEYLRSEKIELIDKSSSFFCSNKIYILKKH
jgi:2-polyprenyl-3-methyl-5-hydroxy-6-metoxy-1,4-benzoquinol methylase